MKSNKKSRSNFHTKLLIAMVGLIMIERSLMVSGIQSVPEQYLPSKLKKYQSNIHRAHLTFGFVSYGSFLCSMACFALYEAKIFADYAEVATFFIGVILALIFYASFALQSSNVSEALTGLKSTVEQSELKINSFFFVHQINKFH